MIFDAALGLIEKFMPELMPMARQARIFDFPAIAHEVLPKSYDTETVKMLEESFFLPFPVVAVEDKASCVFLWDLDKDQKGSSTERGFLEVLPGDAPLAAFREHADPKEVHERWEQDRLQFRGAYGVIKGSITVHWEAGEKLLLKGDVEYFKVIHKDEGLVAQHSDLSTDHRSQALINPAQAIQELAYFNTPERFVVEISPVKVKKGHLKSGKLLRSTDREHYVLLRPNEIREKMGFKTATGKTIRPHDRRRHFHTFRDDRFVNMKGKTIIIPAVWVGPSEAKVGNKLYKIMLNL